MAPLPNRVPGGAAAALLVLCTAACAAAPRELRLPPPLDESSLSAGDTLTVRVQGQPALPTEFRVEGDGTIQYPYLGRLRVAGLDTSGVARMLREHLAALGVPLAGEGAVSVRSHGDRDLVVLGQVVRPGSFPCEPRMTVARAIAAAGGFTGIADHTVLLTRRVRDGVQTFAIAVDAIAAGRLADVPLGQRDVLMVGVRRGALWQR